MTPRAYRPIVLGMAESLCSVCESARPAPYYPVCQGCSQDYRGLQYAAQAEVVKALRRGELVRPDRCSDCGKPGKPGPGTSIEGHHPDYSKPLEVEWLCRRCHKSRHAYKRDPSTASRVRF